MRGYLRARKSGKMFERLYAYRSGYKRDLACHIGSGDECQSIAHLVALTSGRPSLSRLPGPGGNQGPSGTIGALCSGDPDKTPPPDLRFQQTRSFGCPKK